MSIDYRLSPSLDDAALNALFAASWPDHTDGSFVSVLTRSLAYVAAFDQDELVGFVNVAWDGSVHAFLLDTTVLPSHRRQGIGRGLVIRALDAARSAGMHWVHVDYEEHLDSFYKGCGFWSTAAGLVNLREAG